MKSKQGKVSAIENAAPVRKVRRSETTRQRILDAAALWMNKKGFAEMSLQDLANEVGLQTASFYYHFPSKDALVEEVMRIGIEVVFRDVEEAVASLGPDTTYRERIRTAVKVHLHSLLTHGDYTSANIRNFPLATEHQREKNSSIRRQYAEYWRNLLAEAQDAGEIAPSVDLTLVRLLLIGGMNWSTEWFNPRKKSIDTISDVLCNMIFDGIAPRDGPPAARKTRRAI